MPEIGIHFGQSNNVNGEDLKKIREHQNDQNAGAYSAHNFINSVFTQDTKTA